MSALQFESRRKGELFALLKQEHRFARSSFLLLDVTPGWAQSDANQAKESVF